MINTRFAIRNPVRMVCAWIPTGDSRTALVRVWFKAADPRAVSTMSSLNKEPVELWRCA